MTSEFLPTREGYDRWAEIYDEDDNPLVALEAPRVAEIIGDVRGLRIADVGCGTGRHAARLAAAGARVAALDFSTSILEKPEGFVIVSAVHPAMMLKGVQARFTDPTSGRQVHPRSYPHQMADYVMAVGRARLAFDHLSEHAVGEDLALRLPRARKYLGWPLLLLARLRPC